MKIYKLYNTITEIYIYFECNQKISNFHSSFSQQSFHLLPSEDAFGWGRGGLGCKRGCRHRDLRIFYCFVSGVKYEKELKGRRLKRGPVAYVNEKCFRDVICNCCCCYFLRRLLEVSFLLFFSLLVASVKFKSDSQQSVRQLKAISTPRTAANFIRISMTKSLSEPIFNE